LKAKHFGLIFLFAILFMGSALFISSASAATATGGITFTLCDNTIVDTSDPENYKITCKITTNRLYGNDQLSNNQIELFWEEVDTKIFDEGKKVDEIVWRIENATVRTKNNEAVFLRKPVNSSEEIKGVSWNLEIVSTSTYKRAYITTIYSPGSSINITRDVHNITIDGRNSNAGYEVYLQGHTPSNRHVEIDITGNLILKSGYIQYAENIIADGNITLRSGTKKEARIYSIYGNITTGENITLQSSTKKEAKIYNLEGDITAGENITLQGGTKKARIYNLYGDIIAGGLLHMASSEIVTKGDIELGTQLYMDQSKIKFNYPDNEVSTVSVESGGVAPGAIVLEGTSSNPSIITASGADLYITNNANAYPMIASNTEIKITTHHKKMSISSCIFQGSESAPSSVKLMGLTTNTVDLITNDSGDAQEVIIDNMSHNIIEHSCVVGPVNPTCSIGDFNPVTFTSGFAETVSFPITTTNTSAEPQLNCLLGPGTCTIQSPGSPIFDCECDYSAVEGGLTVSIPIRASVDNATCESTFLCTDCGGGPASFTNEIAIGAFVTDKSGVPINGRLEVDLTVGLDTEEQACVYDAARRIDIIDGVVDAMLDCGATGNLKLSSGIKHKASVKIVNEVSGITEGPFIIWYIP